MGAPTVELHARLLDEYGKVEKEMYEYLLEQNANR
jgi:hypothetical protein